MLYTGIVATYNSAIASLPVEQAQHLSEEITLEIQLNGRPCPGEATITDAEGNVYPTVQIGEQCWMRENLRTTVYDDSTEIILTIDIQTDYSIPQRYYPSNDIANVAEYGSYTIGQR